MNAGTGEISISSKRKTTEDILEVIEAGVKIIGENDIKEAEKAYQVLENRALCHFNGMPNRK